MVGLHVISFSIVRCTIGTSMMIFYSELRCNMLWDYYLFDSEFWWNKCVIELLSIWFRIYMKSFPVSERANGLNSHNWYFILSGTCSFSKCPICRSSYYNTTVVVHWMQCSETWTKNRWKIVLKKILKHTSTHFPRKVCCININNFYRGSSDMLFIFSST